MEELSVCDQELQTWYKKRQRWEMCFLSRCILIRFALIMPEDWTLLQFSKTTATSGAVLCRFRTIHWKKKRDNILFEHKSSREPQIKLYLEFQVMSPNIQLGAAGGHDFPANISRISWFSLSLVVGGTVTCMWVTSRWIQKIRSSTNHGSWWCLWF